MGSTQGLETSSVEKELGALVLSNLNMSKHCAAAAEVSTRASPAEIHSQCLPDCARNTVCSLGSCYTKKGVERLEEVQRRVTKMIRLL